MSSFCFARDKIYENAVYLQGGGTRGNDIAGLFQGDGKLVSLLPLQSLWSSPPSQLPPPWPWLVGAAPEVGRPF